MRLPGWEQKKGSHKQEVVPIGDREGRDYVVPEAWGTLGSSLEEPVRFPQISGQLRMQIQVGVSQGQGPVASHHFA